MSLRDAPLTAKTTQETHEWMRSVNDTLIDITTQLSVIAAELAALTDRVTSIEESL